MLLVMTEPRRRAFSPNRILEAMIGGAVALAVALLFSPDPLLPVSRAAQAVFGRLGRALERTATALDEGDPARAEQALEQARCDRRPAARVRRRAGHQPRDRPHRADPLRRPRADRPLRPQLEQIDLAVRNTRVLARHSLRAIRAGENARRAARRRHRPGPLGVGAGRRPTTSPGAPRRRATLASAAAVSATALGAVRRARAGRGQPRQVRSTAVDLMRAAELVAGGRTSWRPRSCSDAGPGGRDSVGTGVQRTGGVLPVTV